MLNIFRVEGDSMSPILTAGDYVIASRLFFTFQVNQLVIVDHPIYGCIVKRIVEISNTKGFYLSGENANSISSKKIGWVRKEDIKGRVLLSIRKN